MQSAAAKNPHGEELKIQLAAFHYLQEEYKEAAEVYRGVLSRNSRSITALNNLAWILAVQQKQVAEALLQAERPSPERRGHS